MAEGADELPAELRTLARPACVAQVGGFRPPDDPRTSWFGGVVLGAPGEGWPRQDGEPMLGLLQLVVAELPVVPPALEDVGVLCLFIGPRHPPVRGEPNGINWCLRTYRAGDTLAPLPTPKPAHADDRKARKGEQTTYRRFPVRWSEVLDWPSRDELPSELLGSWDEHVHHDERWSAQPGLKVGGWPLTVQSEVDWHAGGERLRDVEHVLQIDGDPKVGFGIGFGGVAYIGRDRKRGPWYFAAQSM